MKKFSIKYSPLILVLLILCLLMFIGGTVLSAIRIFNANNLAVDTVKYSILALLNLVLVCFTVSVLVYGRYVINKDYLVLNIGLIKTKYEIKNVVSINLFKKTNKLVLYFVDQKYTVIIISHKKYGEFISSIREVNPQIFYTENSENELSEK